MVPAALSERQGHGGDWICLECEVTGEPDAGVPSRASTGRIGPGADEHRLRQLPRSLRMYPAAMEDAVVLKVVSDETEAEIVCGLLRSAGLECGYRDTEEIDSPLEDFTAAGPREILVHASDLEVARALVSQDGR